MMDIGPPDQKRPRLTGPAPGPWPSSTEASRQLPPVPAAASSYQQHPSPFSRPPDPQHLLDRRSSAHTEHAQYDQESRRPSSGPSHVYHHPHPPPPFGAQRETMVKRDPSDEPPSQYRPPSTGAAGDHNVTAPPPHHDASGRYLPPFEPRAPYPTSFPPPQSPMSATEPYHPQFPGPPRDAFPSVTYPGAGSQSGKPQRKAQRAAQACDSCRTLKAKCDEGRPSCSSCREKGIDCRYRDPPPKQQDKASADILESLMRIEQSVQNMQSEMAAYSTQMKQIQAVVSHVQVPESALKQEEVQEPDRNPIPDPAQIPPPVEYSAQPSISSESHLLPSTESPYSSTPGQLRLPDRQDPEPSDPEEDEDEGGDPGPPKPPSIPVNHTTGAARLLLVGPIAEMCKGIIKGSKIKNEKYPIIQEEKRGLLRLYGRGEGTDIPLGYDKEPLIDHGSDSTSGDTNSDVSSPAGEEWGQLGGLTPPSTAPENFQRGRISGEGMPDFSRDVVLSLVKNYKETFNTMHPLLIPRGLDLLVENFLKSIPDIHAKPKQVSNLTGYISGHGSTVAAGFVRAPESPGNKRKRSPGLAEYPNEVRGSDWELKSGHPFRSISTALVLCVLALGAIAQHKGKIPDCVPTSDREVDSSWSASPTIRNGHPPSPIHSSPSMSTPMGITSPQDTDRGQARSRRTSIEGTFTTKGYSTKAKNLDVIPGLAYFAYATDIIGNQLGGNSLQHVHVNILAGLYHGQLARVMESHAYIHQACRGLQVILRPKLDRFKKVKAANDLVPARDNPLVIAFWTCLQLESDIVAELPCPHSGILTYEEDMPGPNLRDATNVDGFDARVMESYSAQLYIRKHLNQLHNMFYRPENDSEFPSVFAGREPRHFPTIEACEDSIEHVPIFAPTMKWTDADPPAKDILEARLRAKYYGAQVITYRHFVLKILEHSAAKTSKPGEQISSEFKTGIAVPSINSKATRPEDFDPKVLEYAKKCIRALNKSTTAFYGVGDPITQRLIVTNIWGTAHAQWGNVLTLLAAYQDPILTKFIVKDELHTLLVTTMAFLQLSGHSSSALDIDYRILKHVGEHLGLLPKSQEANTSSSFSSTTTGDVPMT